DIYSLGMIMLEILVGHRTIASKLINRGDRWNIDGSIPPALESMIRNMCSRDPLQRPNLLIIRSQLKEMANTSFDLHVREPIGKSTTRIMLNTKKPISVVTKIPLPLLRKI